MKFLLAILAAMSFQSAQAHSIGADGIESDSGIEGPKYEVIEQELVNLQNEFPALAQRVIYGKSVKGLNLNLIRIQKPMNLRAKAKAVVITGTTHGNEYLNIEDRLPRAFLTSLANQNNLRKYIEKGNIIYIAPIFNPDGYTDDVRENARGKDLNRDFPLPPEKQPGFTQPETKMFADYLAADLAKSGADLSVTLDYHCCIGAFLYPWSYTNTKLPMPQLEKFQNFSKILMAPFNNLYPSGTTPSILGYFAYGTSKDYYFAETGSLSYTMEGAYKVEQQKLPQHIQMWEKVFEFLNGR